MKALFLFIIILITSLNVNAQLRSMSFQCDTSKWMEHHFENGNIFTGRIVTVNGVRQKLLSPCVFYFMETGNVYVGEIENNESNGQGTMYFGDKVDKYGRYEGLWKDGYMHGEGIRYWGDGSIWNGIWFEGKFVYGIKTDKKMKT